MSERIPLYVLSTCPKSADDVVAAIHSTSYIDEITSGEGPREECGLYHLIAPVTCLDQPLSCIEEAVQHAMNLAQNDKHDDGKPRWNNLCVIVADSDAADEATTLMVIETDGKTELDRLKCKARSVLEVAANLSIANMGIEEFREMNGGAEIYDAGQ